MLSDFRVLMAWTPRRKQPLAKAWSVFISNTHTQNNPGTICHHSLFSFWRSDRPCTWSGFISATLGWTSVDPRSQTWRWQWHVSTAEENASGAWRKKGCRLTEKDEGSFAILPGCWWETRDKTGAQMEQALCEAACSNQVRGRFQLAIKEEAIQSERSNLRAPP